MIMAKYVLLYSGGRMPETEAEQATVMQVPKETRISLGRGLFSQVPIDFEELN